MSKEMIFGVEIEEIKKQLSMNPIPCDKNSPIKEGEFLEACLRGGEKILKDDKKKEMLKKIYRR